MSHTERIVELVESLESFKWHDCYGHDISLCIDWQELLKETGYYHRHANNGENDICAECGYDLRHKCHAPLTQGD